METVKRQHLNDLERQNCSARQCFLCNNCVMCVNLHISMLIRQAICKRCKPGAQRPNSSPWTCCVGPACYLKTVVSDILKDMIKILISALSWKCRSSSLTRTCPFGWGHLITVAKTPRLPFFPGFEARLGCHWLFTCTVVSMMTKEPFLCSQASTKCEKI